MRSLNARRPCSPSFSSLFGVHLRQPPSSPRLGEKTARVTKKLQAKGLSSLASSFHRNSSRKWTTQQLFKWEENVLENSKEETRLKMRKTQPETLVGW